MPYDADAALPLPKSQQVLCYVAPAVGAIGPAQFAQATEPVPEPGEGQMLVRIAADA